MPRFANICGLLAVFLASSVLFSAPARAEFFGCNDKPGRVLASYKSGQASRNTREFAAQSARPRVTIYPRQGQPGRNAKRHCRSWLVKEFRVSGQVIVPRQQCWWQ